ncbi:hypothetical protein NPIL_225531 [Nephila pilipes]|uniref:Uncharacterized protein n=1 Tax=Nephila pilipes TaxID=299642 RepID=A0A8X6QV61_NEPPI|nr:hypothetical protein NPIL_225531 [Nephila pilipes]
MGALCRDGDVFHYIWNVMKLPRVSALQRGMTTYKHTSTVSVWLEMRSARSVDGAPEWTETSYRTARTLLYENGKK